MSPVGTGRSGINFVYEFEWHCSYKEGGNAVKRILIVAAVLLSTVAFALPASAGRSIHTLTVLG